MSHWPALRFLFLAALGCLLVASGASAQSIKDFEKINRRSPLTKLPHVGICGVDKNLLTYRLKNTTGEAISFQCAPGSNLPALYWEQEVEGKWIATIPNEGAVEMERIALAPGEFVDFAVPYSSDYTPARAYLRISNSTGSKASFLLLGEFVK